MQVKLTIDAQNDFDELPRTIKDRVLKIFVRLAKWPEVSGAKPMSYNWTGYHRLRTGDWRVVFKVEGETVIIERIAHRREVYE